MSWRVARLAPLLGLRPLLATARPPAAHRAPMREPARHRAARASTSTPPGAAEEDGGQDWLIVGFGNPGSEYRGTRHNAGFALVDHFAQAEGIEVTTRVKRARAGEGVVMGTRVVLAKPTTYMNLSGEAVIMLRRHYKIPMSRTLVICDDLDLPLGKIRLRGKGSHGGHNGLRSMIARNAGSNEFARLKIGIGRPEDPSEAIHDWVLGKFTGDETTELERSLEEGAVVVRSILSVGIAKALSGQRV